ncbi:MAG TPA: MFS transporter [Xanthobacteraceae bacterium]|jgi:MFS family permease|nr:MFS transporter [Xanthobacteraceae bacterium]
MPTLRDVIAGPWRAVLVLGVTEILAWGTIFYPPVLTVPLIAQERGWSMSFAMGGFSLALLTAGLVSPRVGMLIDRHGGYRVMSIGSLLAALGLALIVYADHPAAYLAVWMLLGVATAATLYDPAFATLGRIFGIAARRPITALTLAGGFASTVSWPVTHLLLNAVGWRGTYLVYAAVLALVAAPLHAFALPRTRADAAARSDQPAQAPITVLPPTGWPFLLVAAAFAAYAFVPSGLSAHLLAIFARAGIDAATVVAIGALFGPAQVAARICELMVARRIHPLFVARFAVAMLLAALALLALFGLSVPTAAAFAVMFGMANGLLTIARGAVPLALFGAAGYGHLMGRIGGPYLVMQAIAPLALAFVAERAADPTVLAVVAAFAAISFIGFVAVRRPKPLPDKA